MLQDTKNHLSEFQLEVLKNTRFFDTKREVVQIISAHFHELQLALTETWKSAAIRERYASPAPKIFKGENYKNYPYVNMDFPRVFGTDCIFAFRSMFWWGNHFSFTLHLQGQAYTELAETMAANAHRLEGKGYFRCVNNTPWEYHFSQDNYRPIDEVITAGHAEALPADQTFVKISRRLDLDEYQSIVAFGTETFRELLGCLE
jgi:hypothetical protein